MSNSTRNIIFNNLSLMKKSRRVITIATKVTPEFDEQLRRTAQKEGLLLTEMLEKLLEFYLTEQEKIKEEKKETKEVKETKSKEANSTKVKSKVKKVKK